ncbi:MAG: hypothetical protein DRP45_06940 [Candidatus Zixiibacteriota bacterium]|nr:MAG: hypothetical protein DRP45_06940 [candidate division Zixibacteria bacterium]
MKDTSDNTLTVLGSSSGMPQANRACSGYVLQTGESLSLIDCGGGVCSSFLRCGFDPFKLDRIFVSHTHSDHVCDLSLIIQMLHVLRTGRRLDVYLPGEFIAPFRSYLNAVYLLSDNIKLELRIHGYSDGLVYENDRFKLTAIGNSHLVGTKVDIGRLGLPNRMQCCSFRIDVGDRSVFYSADIGSFEDIRDQLQDLDYALVETTHVNLEHLFDHMRSSTVGEYILTHLGDEEEVAALRNQIERASLTNVSLANDGLRLEL